MCRQAACILSFLPDFLFGSVVTYPEIGERFVGILLKTIFGKEFRHLSVASQKVFYGAGAERHGARLDVYLEPDGTEDGRAAVYDIEPDRRDDAATLFLYTRGTAGIPSEAVRQLLQYMEETTYGNAVNEDLREIHRMVETVKRDPEVGGMRIQIVEEVLKLSEEVTRLTEEKARTEQEKARAEEERARAEEERARAEEEKASLMQKVQKLEETLAKRNHAKKMNAQ